jgi:hypothetical protein
VTVLFPRLSVLHAIFYDILLISRQGEDSSVTTPSPRTHDTSRSIYHLKDVSEFAAKLDQVSPNPTSKER